MVNRTHNLTIMLAFRTEAQACLPNRPEVAEALPKHGDLIDATWKALGFVARADVVFSVRTTLCNPVDDRRPSALEL